ncbi:MAG: ferredoxin family protein [Planctomycetota bacterium]|nr:MAG: ferredoxin family protein [Planctomycetota bacterium]
MSGKLNVVIAQHQGKNPGKRQLEEDIAAALIMEPGLSVSIVPHLYDLTETHTGTLHLRSVSGDLLVLAWLYPRAARWTLDRLGVRGKPGRTRIGAGAAEQNDTSGDDPHRGTPEKPTDARPVPDRFVFCVDLRDVEGAQQVVEEVRRLRDELSTPVVPLTTWIQGSPRPDQMRRFLNGDGTATPPAKPDAPRNGKRNGNSAPAGPAPLVIDDPTPRRWYPVIDYDRCTNCMECIDFCLFGVYGVDDQARIMVEQQDNCKKGCPACSRVCPENAIIFPGHKSPAIAGAEGEVAGLKIDLSRLFGAPSALEIAVQERDRELIADGREAVGMTKGIPKRQANAAARPRDELDDLMDGLDALDL